MNNAPEKIYLPTHAASLFEYENDRFKTTEYIRADLVPSNEVTMQQMTDEEIREAFEEWWTASGDVLERSVERSKTNNNHYKHLGVREAYDSWQAAFEFMQQRMRKRNG